MDQENIQQNTEEALTGIKYNVLNEIRSGEISMRPKFQFKLKLTLLVFVVVMVAIFSVFLLNFIVFSSRINHYETLLSFGGGGILAFIQFFPWYLLLVDLLLLMGLEFLIRKFRFGSKVPVLYLLLILIGSTMVVGFAIDRATDFNDTLLLRSNRLPSLFGDFYQSAENPQPKGSGVCFCKILSISTSSIIVEDSRNEGGIMLVLLPGYNAEMIVRSLKVGTMVFIAGKEKDGTIEAFGIRTVNP